MTWRFRHLFLGSVAPIHGVLVAYGYPFAHEFLLWIPQLWKNADSGLGIFYIFSAVIAIMLAAGLFAAPALSLFLLFLVARRWLPQTMLSLRSLSFWTAFPVLAAAGCIGLQLAVAGGIAVPGALEHPVPAFTPPAVVPHAEFAMAIAGAFVSAALLGFLARQMLRPA